MMMILIASSTTTLWTTLVAAMVLLTVMSPRAVHGSTAPSLAVTSFESLATPATVGERTGPGALSIELDMGAAVVVGPSSTITTRVFNGMLPGPTWRVRRGDTVTVTYTNTLGPEPDNYVLNEFGHVNTTNLHTHGLHIDSSTGSDDIFLYVHPGTSFTYTFKVDESHMPGTHWYHPHVHGSAALQAGGGAFGVLIVEDEEETLPPEIADLPEVIMAINHMNTEVLSKIARESRDELFSVMKTSTGQATDGNDDEDLVFVNGQHQPVIAMVEGQWARWRMVMASNEQKLELTLIGCELQLLAKDGVYLSVAPRTVTAVHLAPGGRADVAVRCPAAGSYSLVSQGRSTHDKDGFIKTIASVEVAADSSSPVSSSSGSSLQEFSVPRPCYLVDLTQVADNQLNSGFDLDLGRDQTINGKTFKGPDDYITQMAVGTVQQWDVTGIDNHPLHIHVNPFQISALQTRGATDPYFQVGDWHDVLQVEAARQASIRFQTNVHTGKLVVHCHILEHEDRGMMAVAEVSGSNGAVWAGARSIDPTCQVHGSTTKMLEYEAGGSASSAARRQANVCFALVAMLLAAFPLFV